MWKEIIWHSLSIYYVLGTALKHFTLIVLFDALDHRKREIKPLCLLSRLGYWGWLGVEVTCSRCPSRRRLVLGTSSSTSGYARVGGPSRHTATRARQAVLTSTCAFSPPDSLWHYTAGTCAALRIPSWGRQRPLLSRSLLYHGTWRRPGMEWMPANVY